MIEKTTDNKKQQFNPFLPLNEYIPDGEPHVFDDRVYLFGSHDKEGGAEFCMLDYVAYSAPVNDLKDWRYEGVIYKREQDPQANSDKKDRYMYAPDVVRGNDGRYYLYYSLDGFKDAIKVAVCDEPAGKYEYYGYVKNTDGTPFLKRIPFDPGVINDNGIIRLYYGWALHLKNNPLTKLSMVAIGKALFGKSHDEDYSGNIMGANTVVLDNDMLTVKSEVKRIVPCQMEAKGTDFYDHAFYEGSSIRKIGSKYYFIYSSHVNHELCYATSNYPDKDFKYGGVIISNGDIGYKGRLEKDRLNTTGNIHGSIENINGKWYIFYHRHTHNRSCCRQACAEEIQILEDGSIPQVEVTSCGLNGGALNGNGIFPAIIACNITDGKMEHIVNGISKADKPFITHDTENRYITNIKDGVTIGYKYFDLQGKNMLNVKTRGTASGVLTVYANEKCLGEIKVTPSPCFVNSETMIEVNSKAALYFKFKGKGKLDFLEFEIINI